MKLAPVFTTLRVAFFLGVNDIKQSNPWTTVLIIFVMILSFLNILALRGTLLGIAEGITRSTVEGYTGDILISKAESKTDINDSNHIIQVLEHAPGIQFFSARYTSGVTVEANYKSQQRLSENYDTAGGTLVGIDPLMENQVTHAAEKIIEGAYLAPRDFDWIVLGKDFLEKYSTSPPGAGVGRKLTNVTIGSVVRIKVSGVSREVRIKGILDMGSIALNNRAFMLSSVVKGMINTPTGNVNEIAVVIKPGASVSSVLNYLKSTITTPAVIQTAEESIGGSTASFKQTFSLMGDVIGIIGLVVAAITIFIVIFVNAITRRKYIGILKGIGITQIAIEISYVYQALFYCLTGIFFGGIIIFWIIKPYLNTYPFTLPIGNMYFAAELADLVSRGSLLILATTISGFIPAWMVCRQNTLDAILGR